MGCTNLNRHIVRIQGCLKRRFIIVMINQVAAASPMKRNIDMSHRCSHHRNQKVYTIHSIPYVQSNQNNNATHPIRRTSKQGRKLLPSSCKVEFSLPKDRWYRKRHKDEKTTTVRSLNHLYIRRHPVPFRVSCMLMWYRIVAKEEA